jgi:hypothetical protein
MSGAVTSVPVRQQLTSDKRRGRLIALAVVTLAAALLVTLALVLSDDDTPTGSFEQPVQVQSTDFPTPAPPVDGIRYDGGPEEGSAGTVDSSTSSGLRYDGGPEEGSRGPSATAR